MNLRHSLIFSLFLISSCIIKLYGQKPNYILTGQLEDSFSFIVPSNAHIILLRNNDTISQNNSDNTGIFKLSVKDSGTYQLYINHPNYIPFIDSSVSIRDKITSLGLIELKSKSKLLDEVIIRDNATSQIHQDTTIFVADSFTIKKFSSAKELLTKIPGIEISQSGQITYNGKNITDVSLDNIPLLSFDPNRLLNLLRGKDLDKVQLFDIKSQQSRLTGIDDNARGVGINLILKEEAKTGYYGKLAAGLGAGKTTQWDNSGNVNSFNDGRRIMLFAETNNTAGGSSIGETNLPQPTPPAQGIPKLFSVGGHYDTRLLKNKKLSFNVDYLFNENLQDVKNISNSTNLIPGNEFNTQATNATTGNLSTHNTNLTLNYQLTPSSFINATVNANTSYGKISAVSGSSSTDSIGNPLNNLISNNSTKLLSPNTMANLYYQNNFANPGRSLYISFVTSLNKNHSNIDQTSSTTLFTGGQNENINQRKNNDQNTQNYIFNVRYTQPLKKGLSLDLNFSTIKNKSLADNRTYDLFEDAGTMSDTLNSLYSSNYNLKSFQTQLKTALKYQSKKILFSLGGEVSQLNWNQNDLINNLSLKENYLNFLPTAYMRINMTKYSLFNFEYKTQTTQPQLNQIQPLINNTDPLHIVLGNPDLTQSYTHNFTLNYSNIKPHKNRYFNTNATFALVENAITLKQYYDQAGKEVSQYYNASGNYTGNIFINYNYRLFSKIQFALNANTSISENNALLNNQNNKTFNQQYRAGYTVSYTIDTSLNISYSFSYSYSLSSSSQIQNSANKLWGLLQNLDFIYSLPHGFEIGNRFNWSLRTKTSGHDPNASIFLWNFSLSKYIRKDGSLSLKLYVYDLLNQNKNYELYYGPNIKSENTTNTIGRYLMLGAIWNFTKRHQVKSE